MSLPDYIVIRRAPDLPEEFDIGEMEGKWLDMRRVPFTGYADWNPSQATAVATGRFEVREDGAVAEVYEVRP